MKMELGAQTFTVRDYMQYVKMRQKSRRKNKGKRGKII